MTEDSIKWPSGNKQGCAVAHEGDGVKIYPDPARENSGGTVQHQSTNALNTYTGCGSGVVVRDEKTPESEDSIQWPCDENRGNSSGYMEAQEGDGLVMSRPTSSGVTVKKGLSPTLKTNNSTGVVTKENGTLRIRYLTPRECLRLMGQSEDAIDRLMAAEPSRTRQYKAAGNSIVVDVLVDIFRGIYIDRTFGKKEKRPSLEEWL